MLGKEGEIRRRWKIGVDEDLTMEERRVRGRMLEMARKERGKGKKVENRRIES